MNSLKKIIGDEIMILSTPGVATMLISKSRAATVFQLDRVDQYDFDLQVKAVASKIAAETQTLGAKFLHYSNIDTENIFAFTETLLDLLSHISPNLTDISASSYNWQHHHQHNNNQTNYTSC